MTGRLTFSEAVGITTTDGETLLSVYQHTNEGIMRILIADPHTP